MALREPQKFRTGLLVWPCRRLGIHEPHDYEARVARAVEHVHCPGVEHDHTTSRGVS